MKKSVNSIFESEQAVRNVLSSMAYLLVLSLYGVQPAMAAAEARTHEANASEANPAKANAVNDKEDAALREDAPLSEEEQAAELAKLPHFDVMEYRVEGNSVLTTGKIEEAVYPFMGEQKTIRDVEKARAALEKQFHDAGYLTVFVSIPEQDVGAGVVRLSVLEGKVERLRVVGSRYYALGKIKARVDEFEEGKVPQFKVAQKQLSSVSGQDRQVTPVLRPGKTPGKVEVDLKVKDQFPFHGNVELNNRYTADTTQTRLSMSARYTNLWQLDHSVGVSMQVTPEDTNQVKVFAGTYVIPTLAGDYWAAYAVVSDSNISTVGDISVVGKGNIYGLRYIHPLPALEGFSHNLTLGVDYKDFKEAVSIQGADISKNPIRYMPFSADYEATWLTPSSRTELGVLPTFSVRNLVNNDTQFALKRFGAKSDFAYLRTNLKHTQTLSNGWQIVGKVSGQVSTQNLISNEQFLIGGDDSVRGYLESNSFGDKGVYGSLEVRTPSLAPYLNKNIAELYALGFYDAGHVRLISGLPDQTSSFTLESTGVGLVLKGWKGMYANLMYGHALHDAGRVQDGDDRVHFRLGYDW